MMGSARAGFSGIPEIAKECKSLFLVYAASPSFAQHKWVRPAQVNFNLWCAGINAIGADKSSLDYRLRSRPDVRDAIRVLLQALVAALGRCQQLIIDVTIEDVDGDADGESPDAHLETAETQSHVSWDTISNESTPSQSSSEDETSDLLLAEQITYVKTIISKLQRMSLAIRKSGNKYRFQKADATLSEHRLEEFRTHLTTVILRAFEDTQAKDLTTEQKMVHISDYERLTPVQRSLVRANLLRRNRIEYVTGSQFRHRHTSAEKHPKSAVEAEKLDATESVTNSITPNTRPTTSTASRIHQPPKNKEDTRPSAPTTVISATDIGSKLDIRPVLETRTASIASNITRIAVSQTYPGCPDPGPDGEIVCPYCEDVLPMDLSRSKLSNSWKAHVAQDLLPYSCIVEGCESADEMYLTADDLLAHMLKLHSDTRWTCDYCSYGVAGEDASKAHQQIFDRAEDWKKHTLLLHGDLISPDQCDVLTELKRSRLIHPLHCPLCEFKMESMSTEIDDHILQHLHQFALRALPEQDEKMKEAGSNTSQVSCQLSHTELTQADSVALRSYPVPTVDEFRDAIKGAPQELQLHRFAPDPPFINLYATDYWFTHARHCIEALAAFHWITVEPGEFSKRLLEMQTMEIEHVFEETSLAALNRFNEPLVEEKPVNPLLSSSLPSRPNRSSRRAETLDNLEIIFGTHAGSNIQTRVALVSPERVDTVSIAWDLADSLKQPHFDVSIFWVDASSKDTIYESYGNLQVAFPSHSRLVSDERNVFSFLHTLTWSFTDRWLMVFANLSSSGAQYLSRENLLPDGLNGCLLFTTSEPSCLALLGITQTIRVPHSHGWSRISARLKTFGALYHVLDHYEQIRKSRRESKSNKDLELPVSTGVGLSWRESSRRTLARLYAYTTLSVSSMREFIDSATLRPNDVPGKDSANKKLNALLDKEPRWLRPRTETDLNSRLETLAQPTAFQPPKLQPPKLHDEISTHLEDFSQEGPPNDQGNKLLSTEGQETFTRPIIRPPRIIPEAVLDLDSLYANQLSCRPEQNVHDIPTCLCRVISEINADDWVTAEGLTPAIRNIMLASSPIELMQHVDAYGNTPLHLVAAREPPVYALPKLVQAIRSETTAVQSRNSAGQTFLHVLGASWFDFDRDSLHLLLKEVVYINFDIFLPDIYGQTFFHVLQRQNQSLLAEFLQMYGQNRSCGRDAFGTKPGAKSPQDQRVLLDPTIQGPLDRYVKQEIRRPKIRRGLLDPLREDARGRNSLQYLAELISPVDDKAAKLSNETNASAQGDGPPSDSSRDDPKNRLELLLDFTKDLIKDGADVNHYDCDGNTVLMTFVKWLPEGGSDLVSIEILDALIDAGASIDARNRGGGTALHVAVRHGRGFAANTLIRAGANIFVRDHKGRSLLDLADKLLGETENNAPHALVQVCRALLLVTGAVQNPTVKQEWGARKRLRGAGDE